MLANRLAAGMKAAWEATNKVPISSVDLEYHVRPTALPLRRADNLEALRGVVTSEKSSPSSKQSAAYHLSWTSRCLAGHKIDLTALRLGPAWVLHMPGELFIEYQLAAQKIRPESAVCMAAYGDLAPGYIGTAHAYEQGGYEPRASRVSPAVEKVLLDAIGELLK